MFVKILYLCTVLYFVRGDNDNNTSTFDICKSDYKFANNTNIIFNITESCSKQFPCIAKCCPVDHILVLHSKNLTCLENTNVSSLFNITVVDDYSDVVFYENNIKQNIRESTIKLDQFRQIYKDGFVNDDCSMNFGVKDIYLLENGTAVFRRPNYYDQWFLYLPPAEFCVDHQIVVEKNGHVSGPELVIRALSDDDDEEDETIDKNTLTASAMLVSCVFLLLVLAVYSLLPQLRNLAGLMLMTYVATLTATFMIRAFQVMLTNNGVAPPKVACICVGLFGHYTLVSSFTWMNVMSFDIWWSMRGFRNMRETYRLRRSVPMKFWWYGLYGWGAPLSLTLFMIIVENMDLSHMPSFVKSNYLDDSKCFIEGKEQILYLDCPILITTCINIMLFLMTACNIWRIKRGVTQHSAADSKNISKNESRFGIYLKLSLVMGINWILEVISVFYENESLWWYAPDIFNSLTGLFIFIIFVCKQTIIVQLCKRLKIELEIVRRWEKADPIHTESTRLNGRNSRSSQTKREDSVTETSDVYDQERKYYFGLRVNDKPS